LKTEDFEFYKKIIPNYFPNVDLYVIRSGKTINAFMGVSGDNLELLFVLAESRGKGYGKSLLIYALNNLNVEKVDVNEWNALAVGFYEKFGFKVVNRSEKDSMGKDYPILKMEIIRYRKITYENKKYPKMNTDYKVDDLIYDANIYDGLNTFLSDLQFYKKWLPKNKDAKILEFCCGTGRLTLPIAEDGYNISGVDYTSSMLEQAKVKASEAGLEINFIEADIRILSLQEKFDLIFIPFNSIYHLYRNEDLFKTLNVVKNHLKENGLFLLDCFNPNIQYIVEGEKEQKIIAEYTTNDGREVLIKQIMCYENAAQVNRIE
jgi:2-polyprenyl-3-methyl-5-hydroxy-6-metoxy-1,4-benzoquinol methylase